jgi:hypothetical protein
MRKESKTRTMTIKRADRWNLVLLFWELKETSISQGLPLKIKVVSGHVNTTRC